MADTTYPLTPWGPFGSVDEVIALVPAESGGGISQSDLDAAIAAALSTIKLEGENLTYNLLVNNNIAGTINIPEDQFLSNVEYDNATKDLIFTFEVQGKKEDIHVYIGDLVQEYTAGDGISISDNKISIVVDPNSEAYISVGENGLKLDGIDATYARKTDIPSLDGYATEAWVEDKNYLTDADIDGVASEDFVNEQIAAAADNYYTKSESDDKYLTDHQDLSEFAKTADVEDMIGDAVRYTDIANASNPNRKAIVMQNHDTLLGTATNGSTYNLAMVSKWDVADYGSNKLHFNINSTDRPTVNDGPATAENPSHNGEYVAYLSDVPTKTSELDNDSGFITEADVTPYDDTEVKSDIADIKDDVNDIQNTYASQQWVEDKHYLTEHQDLSEYAKQSDLEQKADASELDSYATLDELALKQDKLAAGDGIKIENGEVSCTLDVSMFKYVEELPVDNINPNKIYLVPNAAGSGNNVFTEYVYSGEGGWEVIGEHKADVDLAPYAKSVDVAATYVTTDLFVSTTTTLSNDVEILKQDVADNKESADTKFSEIDAALANKLNQDALDGFATEAWVTEQNYLTEHQDLSDYATKTFVADTHKNSVDYVDVSNASNPDRQAIVLKNHDIILGTTTTGSTYGIAMISKWDVADYGSVKLPMNFNSIARPTWNDGPATDEYPTHNGEYIAFLSDIPTNVSELANDSDFATSAALADGLATKQDAGDYALADDLAALNEIVAGKAALSDITTINGSINNITNILDDKANKSDISGLATKQEVAAVEEKIPTAQTGLSSDGTTYAYSGDSGTPTHIIAEVSVKASSPAADGTVTYTVKSQPYGDASFSHSCGTIDVPHYTAGAGITIDANNTIKLTEAVAVESVTDELKSEMTANNQTIMSRLNILEDKIYTLSRVNITPVALEAGSTDTTLSDTDTDYVLSGMVSAPLAVTSNSVVISNTEVESNTKIQLTSSEVELKNVECVGDFDRTVTGTNAVVSINNAHDVIIKGLTFSDYSKIYNTIEIGLNASAENLPKNVLIDSCRWEGDGQVHCAVALFGTANDAVVNINNCYVKNTIGLLRLSNRTNAKNVTINITNCQIDNWTMIKSESDAWLANQQGFMLCQDYTSKTQDDFDANNLFGDGKITINIINCTGPDGQRITAGDMSQICGSNTNDQLIYVVGGSFSGVGYVFRPYGDGSYYPTINIL